MVIEVNLLIQDRNYLLYLLLQRYVTQPLTVARSRRVVLWLECVWFWPSFFKFTKNLCLFRRLCKSYNAMLCQDKKWTRLGLWHIPFPGSCTSINTSRVRHDACCKTAPSLSVELLCPPDVSPGFLCLAYLKSKRRNLRWAMSINSDCANFLIINCAQKLPENESAFISATMGYTFEEDRDIERNFNAAVRGSIHILPYLTHIGI